MADLGFGVLGPLEVWRGGHRVAVPGGRRRSVLAALLARAGSPVPADTLVEAAWCDDLPADPRAALHTVVSRLRSLLGDGALRAGPAGYQIDVPADALDALRFERLCHEAGAAGPEQAAVLLDMGLGLWRGPAYAEFADRDFAEIEARRLELLRADAWEERARIALDLGDPKGAVQRLEALLAEHPFREHAIELLMTALHQAGRTGDALARYRDHRRRMAGELGLDPSPALRELEARILGQGGGPPRAAGSQARVPAWVDTSTSFLGRERELASLVETTAGNKVVTVTGTGGVGKTRLVAEALPALAARIGLPVAVVELAAVEPGGAAATVADALGLGRSESDQAALVGRLRADPAILILDNCEHLLAEVASLADLLARRCPQVRVVLTSRHRLGLPTEHVLPVEPLPGPPAGDPPDRARDSAAVALLTDRVHRARPAFTVTPENLSAITGICRRLDGLPLALELAASRVAALGPDAVRDGLERDPGLLDEAASGRRPLRALVDWSCNLLTSGQQDLFAALSVFPGDFDLTAAQSVARGLQLSASGAAVAGMLAELVDSSLVSAYQATDGPRYRLLTVVRAQADRRLATSGRADLARRAHAAWVAELTGQAARDWTGPGAAAALRRLQRSQTDIMTVLRWALRTGELDLAASIAGAVEQCPHWTPRPELSDLIIKVGERCLRHDGSAATLGVAAAGVALVLRGDLERSVELGQAAIRFASTTAEQYLAHLALGVAAIYAGDHEDSWRHWQAIANLRDLPLALRTDAHTGLALLARYAGDLAPARDEGRLAVMLAETSGSAPVRAFALYAAGEAEVAEPDHGIGALTEAAEEAAAIGAAQVSQVARVALFAALVRTGHHDRAVPLAATLLHDVRRAGAWPQVWTTVRILAELQAATGRPHEAALLLAAADTHPTAPPATGDDIRRYASLGQALRTRLGDQIADRIRAAARGASREQIADRAAAVLGRPATTAPPDLRPCPGVDRVTG